MRAKFINESLSFKRELDPYSSIGVGAVNLIKQWLDKYKIEDYIINDDDLTIDVNGDVDLYEKNLNKFPDYIQFNIINGDFSCSFNNLSSLKGCPKEVIGCFYCVHNDLFSLKGCPKIVNGNFSCWDNNKQFSMEEVRYYCKVKGVINIF